MRRDVRFYEGLKFKHLNLANILCDYRGFSLWVDGREVVVGGIEEFNRVLKEKYPLEDIVEFSVVGVRSYFDLFVVELDSRG